MAGEETEGETTVLAFCGTGTTQAKTITPFRDTLPFDSVFLSQTTQATAACPIRGNRPLDPISPSQTTQATVTSPIRDNLPFDPIFHG